MKSIKFALTFVMVVNSTTAFAGPREDAQVAIGQSHKAARLMAQEYLREDLGTLIQTIAQTPPPSPLLGASLPQQIQALNQNILSQLASMNSPKDMNIAQLGQLVEAYRSFVRERFKASFDVQELVYQQQMSVRTFELPFEGFATLCRSGRSAKNTIGEPGTIPRIPNNQYSFNMSYGSDQGDKGVANYFNFQASGPGDAIKDRDTANGILGTASGLSWSIAYSGATGASVSMAMAVAPYLTAAFLAYSAVNYLVSNEEEIARKNEEAQAHVDLFLKVATDRDVAAYYRETCTNTMSKIQPLMDMIHDFSLSDTKREEIRSQIEATRVGRQTYKDAAVKTLPSRNLLRLASFVTNKFCDDAKFVALCKKSEGTYVLSQAPSVKYNPNSEEDKKALAAARQEMIQFDGRYPQELVLKYVAYETLDVLYNQWNDLSLIISNASFTAVDQAMNILANKLQFFVIEAQKAQNSPWAKSTGLLNAEQKLQDEFFGLREEYFQLLTAALKIFFNKSSAEEGKARFKQFAMRFNIFSGKTISNPDVQSMAQAVSRLGKFYEQL